MNNSRPAKNWLLIILFVLFPQLVLYGQTDLAVSFIPDSLKTNAHSVIRYKNTVYKYQNAQAGEEIRTSIVTILNDKGKEDATFVVYGDKFRELKKFSGEVYDANGKLIRKIKKSDLRSSEYSTELASDGISYFYECTSPFYPFTVKYEWEIKHKNGVISFPHFLPQSTYYQSIVEASYQLQIPDNVPFKYKALNMGQGEPEVKSIATGFSSYIWTVKAVPAIEPEIFSPEFLSQIPTLYTNPVHFQYDGSTGDMTDWKSYGLWQYGLLQNRDQLPDATKQKVREMTQDLETDREKVEKLFNYLGETTRYVSIQLGIGGLQPMPAAEVAKTGFGDCKALSNYMMAMLREINIPSYYTVINMGRKRILKDYSSANQMNHVILQVPLPGDTLWLECTNPEIPAGYVHTGIVGNDAILIKETGGEFCRLPLSPDSLNTETQQVVYTLLENGSVTGKVDYKVAMSQYEQNKSFIKRTPKEQMDILRKRLRVPQAKIGNISSEETKTDHPTLNITYELSSDQFGSKTGSRWFLPANALRDGFRDFKKSERKNNIVIGFGNNDSDIITFIVPDNYTIEALPKPVLLVKEYGTFISVVQAEGNEIKVYQQLKLNSGVYNSSIYNDFIQFFKAVSDEYQSKIVLKKN